MHPYGSTSAFSQPKRKTIQSRETVPLKLRKYSMVSLNPQATFLLVGCKRDLATEGHREVSVEEAQVRVQYVVRSIVYDPSHFLADPDPALQVRADPDPVIHVGADPNPTLHVGEDPYPAFYVGADKDAALQVDADPDPDLYVGADPDPALHVCVDPALRVGSDPDPVLHVGGVVEN
jgi:hypothetical protein